MRRLSSIFVSSFCGALVLSACLGSPEPNTPEPEQTEAEELGLPPASTFSCADADAAATACVDFNDGDDGDMAVESGTWRVVDGRYVGWGPDVPTGACPDSLLSRSILTGATAQDVRVTAQLSSLSRVDKAIVLRSAGASNHIELNFRANDDDGLYGDLIVQQTTDCVFSSLTAEGQIEVPHDMGERIDVDATLTGTWLRVLMNGVVVLDADFPSLEVRAGQVGVGIIDRSLTLLDDLVMTSLDP